jgi:flavin-dependent dehydrogenase
VVHAGSTCLERVTGSLWCAVGDAACTHDPLSSQGIVTALAAGVEAGRIVAHPESRRRQYETAIREGYARYVAQWLNYYLTEQRWPDAPFWRKRHLALAQLLAPHPETEPPISWPVAAESE